MWWTIEFEEITLYDAAVSFTEEMDAQTQQAFSRQVRRCVGGGVPPRRLRDGGGRRRGQDGESAGASEQSGGHDGPAHRGGEKLSMPGTGETLLNDALAEALGVSVGDTVTLRDSDMNTLTVTVSGIFDNYVSNYAIVSADTCRDQWGSVPPVKTAFISGGG